MDTELGNQGNLSETFGVCTFAGKKPTIGVEPNTPAATIHEQNLETLQRASLGSLSIPDAREEIRSRPSLTEAAKTPGTPTCSSSAINTFSPLKR